MKSKLLVTAAVLVCAQALIANASDEVTFEMEWGTPGMAPGQFTGLWDLGVDAENNIYAADEAFLSDPYRRGRFQVFSNTGVLYADVGYGVFRYAKGICVDSSNTVYVGDDLGRRIVRFSRTGSGPSMSFSEIGSFNISTYPYKSAMDADDSIFIGEYWSYRVRKYTPEGGFLMELPGPDYVPYSTRGQSFNLPITVAVDAAGNIYVGEHDAPGYETGRSVVKFARRRKLPPEWGAGWADHVFPCERLDPWNQRHRHRSERPRLRQYQPPAPGGGVGVPLATTSAGLAAGM